MTTETDSRMEDLRDLFPVGWRVVVFLIGLILLAASFFINGWVGGIFFLYGVVFTAGTAGYSVLAKMNAFFDWADRKLGIGHDPSAATRPPAGEREKTATARPDQPRRPFRPHPVRSRPGHPRGPHGPGCSCGIGGNAIGPAPSRKELPR